MTQSPKTPLLDQVTYPADLRKLEDRDLPQLAREVRDEMIDAVSRTGGHLGAGLGVVELTIATVSRFPSFASVATPKLTRVDSEM